MNGELTIQRQKKPTNCEICGQTAGMYMWKEINGEIHTYHISCYRNSKNTSPTPELREKV